MPEEYSRNHYCYRLTVLAARQAMVRDWITTREEKGWPVPEQARISLHNLALARSVIVREIKTLEEVES